MENLEKAKQELSNYYYWLIQISLTGLVDIPSRVAEKCTELAKQYNVDSNDIYYGVFN